MPRMPSILGKWRITRMDEWDAGGYIRIDPDGVGEFEFGYVWGEMTCEFTQREGRAAVEWSWEGSDEMHPVSGRGWAVLQDDGTLAGRLCFHSGDKSDFAATKTAGPRKRTRKRRMIRLTPKPKDQG